MNASDWISGMPISAEPTCGCRFLEGPDGGSSIAGAKISGCYFPSQLDPDEIIMSLNHGTRMRYRPVLVVQPRKTGKG